MSSERGTLGDNEAQGTSPSIVLFSYRRPELTSAAVSRILTWPALEKLIISIDGLRGGASRDEANWRNSTIRVSENLASRDSRIAVKVWEVNEGLTRHSLRAYPLGLDHSNSVIGLEEDLDVSHMGLDFLSASVDSKGLPAIASSYSRFNHPTAVTGQRETSFPEQWGASFNAQFFEEFARVCCDKKIDQKRVADAFVDSFPERLLFQKIGSRFWVGLFVEALKNPSRPDALMAYAAISLGIRYKVPWNSLTSDVSHLDYRGMHKSVSSKAVDHLVSISDMQPGLCLECDYSNAKLNLGPGWVTAMVAQEFRIATGSGAWKGLSFDSHTLI